MKLISLFPLISILFLGSIQTNVMEEPHDESLARWPARLANYSVFGRFATVRDVGLAERCAREEMQKRKRLEDLVSGLTGMAPPESASASAAAPAPAPAPGPVAPFSAGPLTLRLEAITRGTMCRPGPPPPGLPPTLLRRP